MRSPLLALIPLACLLACTDDVPAADDGSCEGESEGETASETGTGDGDGDGDEPGDPTPAELPTPTAPCPTLESGNVTFYPAATDFRAVKLWVGDDPQPGGMLVIYWHAFMSAPDEAVFNLSQQVIDAITDAGGIVAAPYPASDVGTFPWFAVNGDDRPDDMLVADEIVACAIEQLGVDPRRIHVTGMSAGGLQTTAFTMARSRYVASAASFSGGAISTLPFEDPDNKFAAMIIHGGDNDIFGGTVNFKTLSTLWYNQLQANGNFSFICDHGGGHTIPSGYGPSVVNFFFAHPFGTEPSPYAAGLPDSMPDACAL